MRAPTRVTLTRASTLWVPRLKFKSLNMRLRARPFLQDVSTNPSSPTASWSCTLASAPTRTTPASAAPAVPGTRRGTPGLQGSWVDVQLTGEFLKCFVPSAATGINGWRTSCIKTLNLETAKRGLQNKSFLETVKSVECLNKHLFILICCIFKISYSLAGATVCVLCFLEIC